jgi:hypothetical protein
VLFKVVSTPGLRPPQIATQHSLWDSDKVEEYKKLYISPDWENLAAFDPTFRWTWREEKQVRRTIDWKVMVSQRRQLPE